MQAAPELGLSAEQQARRMRQRNITARYTLSVFIVTSLTWAPQLFNCVVYLRYRSFTMDGTSSCASTSPAPADRLLIVPRARQPCSLATRTHGSRRIAVFLQAPCASQFYCMGLLLVHALPVPTHAAALRTALLRLCSRQPAPHPPHADTPQHS